jgi:hypothetical protein
MWCYKALVEERLNRARRSGRRRRNDGNDRPTIPPCTAAHRGLAFLAAYVTSWSAPARHEQCPARVVDAESHGGLGGTDMANLDNVDHWEPLELGDGTAQRSVHVDSRPMSLVHCASSSKPVRSSTQDRVMNAARGDRGEFGTREHIARAGTISPRSVDGSSRMIRCARRRAPSGGAQQEREGSGACDGVDSTANGRKRA